MPPSPALLIIPSSKNAARARYPLSSMISKRKNSTSICGKKESTAPTPVITALVTSPINHSAAPLCRSVSPALFENIAKSPAILSPKKPPIAEVRKYTEIITAAKIGIPHILCIKILSALSVNACVLTGFVLSEVLSTVSIKFSASCLPTLCGTRAFSTAAISSSMPVFFRAEIITTGTPKPLLSVLASIFIPFFCSSSQKLTAITIGLFWRASSKVRRRLRLRLVPSTIFIIAPVEEKTCSAAIFSSIEPFSSEYAPGRSVIFTRLSFL